MDNSCHIELQENMLGYNAYSIFVYKHNGEALICHYACKIMKLCSIRVILCVHVHVA